MARKEARGGGSRPQVAVTEPSPDPPRHGWGARFDRVAAMYIRTSLIFASMSGIICAHGYLTKQGSRGGKEAVAREFAAGSVVLTGAPPALAGHPNLLQHLHQRCRDFLTASSSAEGCRQEAGRRE